jgi:hypothetical protein
MISHREPLSRAAELYQKWHDEQDTYTKIVLKPGMDQQGSQVDLVAARQSNRPSREGSSMSKLAVITGASSASGSRSPSRLRGGL